MDERPSHNNAHSTRRQPTGPDGHESQRLTPSCRAGLCPPPRCHPGLRSALRARAQPVGRRAASPASAPWAWAAPTPDNRTYLQMFPRAPGAQGPAHSQGSGFRSLRAPRVCGAQGTHDPRSVPRPACADGTPLTPLPAKEAEAEGSPRPALDRKRSLPPRGATPEAEPRGRSLPQKDPSGPAHTAARGCLCRQAVHTSTVLSASPHGLSTQLPAPGYIHLSPSWSASHGSEPSTDGTDNAASLPEPSSFRAGARAGGLARTRQHPQTAAVTFTYLHAPLLPGGRLSLLPLSICQPRSASHPASLTSPARCVTHHNTAIVTVQLHLSPQGRAWGHLPLGSLGQAACPGLSSQDRIQVPPREKPGTAGQRQAPGGGRGQRTRHERGGGSPSSRARAGLQGAGVDD